MDMVSQLSLEYKVSHCLIGDDLQMSIYVYNMLTCIVWSIWKFYVN